MPIWYLAGVSQSLEHKRANILVPLEVREVSGFGIGFWARLGSPESIDLFAVFKN
jgi:hypothetical protein